jgi:hypothetical protein
MADENPVENPVTMPGRNGGTLRRGGTNKGGPGRPTDEFKRRMREHADAAEAIAGEVVRDKQHPAWLGAAKWVTDRSEYGPVPKPIEVSGPAGDPLVIRIVREG